MLPACELSIGTRQNATCPTSTASKTARIEGNGRRSASGNSARAPSSEYAPASPWYATARSATARAFPVAVRSCRPVVSDARRANPGVLSGGVACAALCGNALIRDPRAEQAPVALDEPLVLVRRERRLHRVDEQSVEVAALDVLDEELVEGLEGVGAELAIVVGVEVRVREAPVRGHHVVVGEILAVADGELVGRRLVDAHRASAREAEERPLDERGDRPREVVVQARERHVRGCVRVVDRIDDAVLDDRFGRVELPAEEGVHEPAERDHLEADVGSEEL